MIVTIVAAISSNYAIGINNKLPWYLPADLKHFEDIVTGGVVIMGRKTYDSIKSPIRKTRNIIVTRQQIEIPGCEVVNSVEAALALCSHEAEVFIVGGAEIYKLAMHLTDKIFLTIVHENFEADTYFPEIKEDIWVETARQDHEADEKNPIPFSFITLERA